MKCLSLCIACFLVCALCGICIQGYADVYSGSDTHEAIIIRTPVWVFLEPQPAVMSIDEQEKKIPPRKALMSVSCFLLSGMVYGWTFSYTPFDKKRSVAEEFILDPVYRIRENDRHIRITELVPRYPYVYCWAEYAGTADIVRRRQYWQSIAYPVSKGMGQADRKREVNGVYQAYKDAAREAVRSYLKKAVKNKPKQVTGEMIIKENPRLFVSSGMFTAELTVYLHIQEVVPYCAF